MCSARACPRFAHKISVAMTVQEVTSCALPLIQTVQIITVVKDQRSRLAVASPLDQVHHQALRQVHLQALRQVLHQPHRQALILAL